LSAFAGSFLLPDLIRFHILLELLMADEQTARPEPVQVPVDESHIVATYANFCRVTGTPDELIVDVGLNKQVGGTAPETIQLTQRIIVNFFTAKRLAYALGHAVARHEQAFGTLETDVQKRVVQSQSGRA